RGDWRSFRVDRLTTPVATGARFRPRELPDGVDAATFVRGGIVGKPTRYEVVVDIRASAEQVRTVTGRWANVDPLADDACRLRMNVDSLDWPTMLLGVVGAAFTVREPAELRDHVAATAELFQRSLNEA